MLLVPTCSDSNVERTAHVGWSRDERGLGPSVGWVGTGRVEFLATCRGLGWVEFNDTMMGWVQRLPEMRPTCKTLHFILRKLN